MKKLVKIIAVALLTCMSLTLSAEPKKVPLAFYLKNLPVERIGELSDQEIISSLRAQGMMVIEVDCSSFPKTSPELEEALVKFHNSCSSVYSKYETAEIAVENRYIFYVPEGYTITRDIPTWNIKDHGADGSMEYVMKTYNEVVAPKHNVPTVTRIEDMKNVDGTPIDWNLYIDIIHPSGKSSKKVPLVINCASNSPRMLPFIPGQEDQKAYRMMFPLGFLTSGYAWAVVDHCYNPLARNENWGYFSKYTLEDWNGLNSMRAHLRYIHTHLDQYNLNGKIGTMGISKASYSSMRAADRNNAEGKEHSLLNGKENTKPQPWPEGKSTIDVAYAAAGNGTRRVEKYANENCVPMITSAGKKDQYKQWDVYPVVVKKMNDIDHNHLALWMEELGHTYPGMGTDITTGEPRYVLFKKFFDRYLKPDPKHDADILYILPKEGNNDIDAKGHSRSLPADSMLPSAMLDIDPYSPVTVRFLEAFNVDEIQKNVTVTDVNENKKIEGQWTAHMEQTSFTFEPAAPLVLGHEYVINVPNTVTSINGNHPSEAMNRTFKVTKGADKPIVNVKKNRIFPTDDSYTTVVKGTKVKGAEPTMRVRYSSLGDWRFDGYIKFDLSKVDTDGMTRATLNLVPTTGLKEKLRVDIYKTATEWDETTLVSANKPEIIGEAITSVYVEKEPDWVEADVTKALQESIANGEKEFSCILRVPGGQTTENIYFSTKENENAELKPFLSIEKPLHQGNPTIRVARIQKAGITFELNVATEYENEIKSISWFIDGQAVEGKTATLEAGTHQLKAIVEGPETIGKDILIKYITVE